MILMIPLNPFLHGLNNLFTFRPKKSTKLMINTKIYKPDSQLLGPLTEHVHQWFLYDGTHDKYTNEKIEKCDPQGLNISKGIWQKYKLIFERTCLF